MDIRSLELGAIDFFCCGINFMDRGKETLSKSHLKLHKIFSTDELRAVASKWDDLWLRSDVCLPRARAHLLAFWADNFVQNGEFQALMVEQGDRLIAALPLVSQSFKGFLRTGCLATGHAVTGGEFLLDHEAGGPDVFDLLVSALARSSFFFVQFNGVPVDEARWQGFLEAFGRAGLLTDVSEEYAIGRVAIRNDWTSYEAGLSRNHRRNRRKQENMMAREGEPRLLVLTDIAPSQVAQLLQRGFEVEDRSWKGREGTSVLKNPDIFDFLCQEAVQLAKLGLLELVFLEHDGKPVAFSYGWRSKGIHYTAKVGYDDSYARYGPGQQLMMLFLRHLHGLPQPQIVDFHGPMAAWHGSWATHSYPVCRVLATTNRLFSRPLFLLNFRIKPWLKECCSRWFHRGASNPGKQ